MRAERSRNEQRSAGPKSETPVQEKFYLKATENHGRVLGFRWSLVTQTGGRGTDRKAGRSGEASKGAAPPAMADGRGQSSARSWGIRPGGSEGSGRRLGGTSVPQGATSEGARLGLRMKAAANQVPGPFVFLVRSCPALDKNCRLLYS